MKKINRSVADLSDREREVLDKLCKAGNITTTGAYGLAKKLADKDEDVTPTCLTTRMYGSLIGRGWITILRNTGNTVLYGVAEEYRQHQAA